MMEPVKSPRVLIIAGPNGAGKTTFAKQFLPHEGNCLTFINADLIAAGLSPFAPARAAVHAAKLMAQAIDTAAAARIDFAVETTLSGRSYIGLIRTWKAASYRVGLVFLRLPSADLAVERAACACSKAGTTSPNRSSAAALPRDGSTSPTSIDHSSMAGACTMPTNNPHI